MASLCVKTGACTSRAGCFGKSVRRTPFVAAPSSRAALVISNSYKNKENIDLSKVAQYQRASADTGSTEVQIARLTARIQQLSTHLGQHKKDFACRRGLEIVLGQRKKLMAYMQRTNKETHDKLVAELGIRPVKTVDTRGASRNRDDKAQ